MSAVTVTASTYNDIIRSNPLVLLDFWAIWCGPCRMMGPIVDELADELEGKAFVGKVNVDEEAELAQHFSVESIPTFVAIKDGKVLATSLGVRPKEDLLSMLGLNGK